MENLRSKPPGRNPIGLRPLLAAAALSLASVAAIAAVAAAAGAPELLGVWEPGTDPYYLWVGDDWQGFTKKWQELAGKGLRLEDVERYVEDGAVQYAGVWRGGQDGHFLWQAADWKSLTGKWKELGGKGLRLIDVETFVEGGARRYIGVWRAGSDAHALWSGAGWDTFVAKWKELSDKGLRLVDVEGYPEDGKTHYLAVFRGGHDAHYLGRFADWQGLTAKWKELAGQGLRLVSVEKIADGGKFWWIGVFRAGKAGALWRSDAAAFFDKWEELADENQRLVDLEVFAETGKPIPAAQGKPISECSHVGPFRHDKQIKGILYGQDYNRSDRTTDSVIEDQDVIKLVGGVCVQEGEVEYTLNYRSNVERPITPPVRLRAGQCSCSWRKEGWPYRLRVKSTVKVLAKGTRFQHKLSVCYTPWRNSCRVGTWEGFK